MYRQHTFHCKNPPGYENVGVGILKDSSLMSTFPIPPLDVPHDVGLVCLLGP
jgi:hypothetical protein